MGASVTKQRGNGGERDSRQGRRVSGTASKWQRERRDDEQMNWIRKESDERSKRTCSNVGHGRQRTTKRENAPAPASRRPESESRAPVQGTDVSAPTGPESPAAVPEL